MAYTNFYLQLFASFSMMILFEGYLKGEYKKTRSRQLFFSILVSDIVMLATGALDNLIIAVPAFYNEHKWLENLFSGISDLSYFLVLAFFVFYLDTYAREGESFSVLAKVGYLVSLGYGGFWLISGFLDGIYSQNAEQIFYGPLYVIGQIGGYVTVIMMGIILIRRWNAFNSQEKRGFAVFILVPLLGSFLKLFIKGVTIMPVLVTISIIYIHSFIQLSREILLRQKEEDISRLQADMVASRLKPHFIYNALNSIYALADISVEDTKNAIVLFSAYLRACLVDIDAHRLVPFEREIVHIREYVSIQKLRFGDKLQVEYDLKEMDFSVPPLSILTVVENAVNYCVEKKNEGGKIEITSYKTDNGFAVKVRDNGDGFDTSKISLDELMVDENGKRHVGLYSAAYRLRNMCGGDLKLESIQGKGTTVTLEIKEGSPNENSDSR